MKKKRIVRIKTAIDDLCGEVGAASGNRVELVLRKLKGTLWVKILDAIGSIPLGETSYRVKGPEGEKLSGNTDEQGVLRHDNVSIGDFEISVDEHYKIITPSLLNPTRPHEIPVRNFEIEESILEDGDEDTDEVAIDLLNTEFESEDDEIPSDMDLEDIVDEE